MPKRCFDLVIAFAALLFLSPLLLLVALVIFLKMGAPVFFRQPRPGLNGRVFYIWKFRSMAESKDKFGNVLPDEDRITRLGNFLRGSSIDELPALWNVLVGDMSLVGPRPLLVEYLELYTPEASRRHSVKPGITGWAQVNGRNNIDWEEKFKLDVWYVDNHNFWLDIKILFTTFKKVFLKENINQDGHATMPVFKGQRADSKGRD